MGFLDFLFGKKNNTETQAAPAQTANNTTVNKPKTKQVYTGRATEVPEWAQNVSTSDLLTLLRKNCVCKYAPNFEVKKIMSAKVGVDGNLVAEYDGIAGDCGAIKTFGAKVAQQQGMLMPYKYFDLNNAYRACCDNPKKCPFYLNAIGENETVNSRRH